MLRTLAISGFRGFKSYKLNDLTTVNLIVGKNNSGKTSVLEAIHLLASGGHLSAFHDVTRRRGELPSSYWKRYPVVSISHLFFGHECQPGARFDLSSDDGQRELSASVQSLEEVGEEADKWRIGSRDRIQEGPDPEEFFPAFGLRIAGPIDEQIAVLPLADDGTVQLRLFSPRRARTGTSGIPVLFVDLSIDFGDVSDFWDKTLTEGREKEVVEDMRLLLPDIDSIHFLTGMARREVVLVGLRGGGPRMPIGSYGDGLRRLLRLRLNLEAAADGFLLIDEIDTGLHWTIMKDVWRLLVEVAKKSKIQIFATTHSLDCIKGLGALMQSHPDLADDVSIQKMHVDLEQAVSFPGEQVRIAVEQDMEVR